MQFVAHGGIQAQRGAQFLHAARRRAGGRLRCGGRRFGGLRRRLAHGHDVDDARRWRVRQAQQAQQPQQHLFLGRLRHAGARQVVQVVLALFVLQPAGEHGHALVAGTLDARVQDGVAQIWSLRVTASRLPWSRTTSRAQSMPPASSMRACRRDCSFSSRRTLAVWRWNRLVVSAATMATMMSALITAAPR